MQTQRKEIESSVLFIYTANKDSKKRKILG